MIAFPLPMRMSAVAALVAFVAAGCADHAVMGVNTFARDYGVARSTSEFTVGPLAITAISQAFPGERWHIRDVQLNGLVTGDLAGTARLTLNGNLDTFVGSGPARGTMTIVTSGGDTWDGSLTGTFVTGAPYGIQLFSQVVLHGPGGQTLKAECNETSVTSETLACAGVTLNPHP